jgi:predicted alpha/beta superfamily hydrolase
MCLLALCFVMITAHTALGQGRVVFEGPVSSRILGTNRFVRIYLPPSYERDPQKRFPVLYLHDGQNVFTTVGDSVAFGWGNWQLDKTVNELCLTGKLQEIIVVAVDCSAQRYLDYRGPAYSDRESPDLKRRPQAATDNRRFDGYARFLIGELKPKIDREYRTLPDPANTGVLGSSMGGICSLALAWEHPEVFGKAASMSGAFQVEKQNFLVNVLRAYHDKPKPIRVYLDSGIADFTGGDDGRKDTEAVAAKLRRIGWRDGTDLLHFIDAKLLSEPELERMGLRGDKLKEAQRSQHNELYWRLRVGKPLMFLFPPAQPKLLPLDGHNSQTIKR